MKQKSKNQKQLKAYLSGALLSVVAVVTVAGLAIVPARADQFDQQIAALQQQNASSLSSLGALQAQAASYQDAINQLQIQIDALQQLINENLTKQHDLQAQIDANEAELARQRELLGQDIKSMYID